MPSNTYAVNWHKFSQEVQTELAYQLKDHDSKCETVTFAILKEDGLHAVKMAGILGGCSDLHTDDGLGPIVVLCDIDVSENELMQKLIDSAQKAETLNASK